MATSAVVIVIVLVSLLTPRKGRNSGKVSHPTLTHRDLADDAAIVRAAIEKQPGPTLVVGHSYGGAVISEAAAGLPNVSGLVYVCAVQLDVGESLLSAVGGAVPSWIEVDDSTKTMRVPDPVTYFFGDVEPGVAQGLADRLTSQTLSSFTSPQTQAAWHDLPSTYVICEQDRAIPPALQETMSTRAGTVHRLDSSHSPFVSRPAELAALLAAAAAG